LRCIADTIPPENLSSSVLTCKRVRFLSTAKFRLGQEYLKEYTSVHINGPLTNEMPEQPDEVEYGWVAKHQRSELTTPTQVSTPCSVLPN
jgi:hypothetical protein